MWNLSRILSKLFHKMRHSDFLKMLRSRNVETNKFRNIELRKKIPIHKGIQQSENLSVICLNFVMDQIINEDETAGRGQRNRFLLDFFRRRRKQNCICWYVDDVMRIRGTEATYSEQYAGSTTQQKSSTRLSISRRHNH